MKRIFVIIGAKGGSGATTLAFELSKRVDADRRVYLVDGDLAGRRSHAVSFDLIGRLDTNRAPGTPAFASVPGRELLELANCYEDGFAVRGDAVEAIVEEKLADEAFVIVDGPQPFAAALRPFVSRAQRFLVVLEPTLLGVSAARQMLSAMTRFGIPHDRIALVINSRDGADEFNRNDIATTLHEHVIAEIPPKRHRNYGRAVQALADDLVQLPALEPIADLRQSASIPIGDRRSTPRTGVAPSPVGAPGASAASQATGARLELAALPAPAKSPDLSAERGTSVDVIKGQVHAAIMERIDFAAAARMFTDAQRMNELRSQLNDLTNELLAARRDIGSLEDAARIRREIVEEALGLGPIESLMNDPSVTEIMVNGTREIFIERDGKIELTARRFVDDRQVRLVIERVLAPLGRRIDESTPMVDARLIDGSRVNATIEPLSIDGPTLTIRRFGLHRLTADDLVAVGSFTPPICAFLRACVRARLNIVVSGGTGSGKTTLLNALSSFIPSSDRIITIEDAAELLLAQPHVIRLEARPPNIEGRGEIRIRDCVRNALRMRPDRIVVGECRGAEALDMLQAMNTGHDGSVTTVHANTARDALSRIETMVMMAGYDLPVRAIREQIASAINIVVQVARMTDGTRRLTSISEVVGMEGDVVTMQEIVRYRRRGLDAHNRVLGSFEYTGVAPASLKRFVEMGIEFDPTSLFNGPSPIAAAAWPAR